MGIQHWFSGLQAHQSRAGISGDWFMITKKIFHDALGRGKRLTARFSPWVSMILGRQSFPFGPGLIFKGELWKISEKNVIFTPFVVDGFRTPTVNSPVEGWGLRERLYWNPIILQRALGLHPSIQTVLGQREKRQGETPFPPPGFPHRSAPGPRSLGHQFATNKIQAKIYLLVLLMAEIPRPTTFWM